MLTLLDWTMPQFQTAANHYRGVHGALPEPSFESALKIMDHWRANFPDLTAPTPADQDKCQWAYRMYVEAMNLCAPERLHPGGPGRGHKRRPSEYQTGLTR